MHPGGSLVLRLRLTLTTLVLGKLICERRSIPGYRLRAIPLRSELLCEGRSRCYLSRRQRGREVREVEGLRHLLWSTSNLRGIGSRLESPEWPLRR